MTSQPPKSGILTIDKPRGLTSHDVIQAVRRAARVRRVGHAGTLDPLATGVLVVCLGSATRVIEEIQAAEKHYRTRVRLGIETSTHDAEGEAVESRDPSGLTRKRVEEALDAFRGEILQKPPMYSALKHEGKRLYELARAGIDVEREPRPVTVHQLEMIEWDPPELVLEMTVSKGTYVRAIARDLGRDLGAGGHLVDLRRTAIGRFTIENAEPLERVVEAFEEGWWPRLVSTLDTALLDHPAMIVDPRRETALRQGQQIDGPPPDKGPALVRAYDQDGMFVGLLRWDALTDRWQPDRVFPKPE